MTVGSLAPRSGLGDLRGNPAGIGEVNVGRCGYDIPLVDAANLDTANMRIDSIEDGNQICRRAREYFSGFQGFEGVRKWVWFRAPTGGL